MAHDQKEIRITGVPPKLKEELENITEHLGTNASALLKPKLREIVDSYPAHMKLPPKKD